VRLLVLWLNFVDGGRSSAIVVTHVAGYRGRAGFILSEAGSFASGMLVLWNGVDVFLPRVLLYLGGRPFSDSL